MNLTRILLFTFASIVLLAPGVRAQIYTWVDENGVKHMESRKQPKNSAERSAQGFDENTKDEFREKAREAAGAQFSEEREPAADQPAAERSLLDRGLAFFGINEGDKITPSPAVKPVQSDPAPSDAASGPVEEDQYPSVRAQVVVGAPKVDLYITSWCPWCRKAQEYFKLKGVPYTAYDIEKDPAAKARKSKLDDRRGVPFVMIGEHGVHGYDPDAYDKALAAGK